MTDLQQMLTDGPAFTSLQPVSPTRFPLPKEQAERIVALVGKGGHAESLGPPSAGMAGRYVVDCADGTALLVKIVSRRIFPLQVTADRVCTHALAHGVATIPALWTADKAVDTDHSALVYPYIDARFAIPAVEEVVVIGRMIAETHLALRLWPNEEDVKSQTASLHDQLTRCAERLAQDTTGWPTYAETVLRAADIWRSRVEIERNAQMIHGDCNFTNVLFDRHAEDLATGCFMLDFEEALTSWMSPWYDMAVAVQRFALVHPDLDRKGLARHLLQSYCERIGGPVEPVDFYRISLEAVSRSILLVVLKTEQGVAIPDAEWKKFQLLLDLVDASKPILDEIGAMVAP